MTELTFIVIALATCVFALLAVLSQDIFHCAVWLAMTLLSIAGVYFYLDAEFLGVVQILVYVGGIITLFIFAIKLTANIGDKSIQQANRQVLASAIGCMVIFYFIVKAVNTNPWVNASAEGKVLSLKELGQSLVTTYALPFEFISLLLLAAMVGAI